MGYKYEVIRPTNTLQMKNMSLLEELTPIPLVNGKESASIFRNAYKLESALDYHESGRSGMNNFFQPMLIEPY